MVFRRPSSQLVDSFQPSAASFLSQMKYLHAPAAGHCHALMMACTPQLQCCPQQAYPTQQATGRLH